MSEKTKQTGSFKKPSGWKGEIFDFVKTLIICAVSVYAITTWVVKPVQVDGRSMSPTLEDKQVGLMNVIAFKMMGVKRFDVVIAHSRTYNEEWVKRVIGMPGDSVYAKDDVVYVNDQPIKETYLDTNYVQSIRRKGQYFTENFTKVYLKENEYFLMGDNRVVSLDSRRVGPFLSSDIKGKDVYVMYPFNEMRIVRNGQ